MGFVIQRADGEQREVSGYQLSASRSSARDFKASNKRKLPPKVDLRAHMTEVENQQHVGSCTANAVVGAYEYLANRYHDGESLDVSRLFVYYNARKVQGKDIEDTGVAIMSAIESLKQHGACSEETWPYDPDQVNEEPPEEAYEEASQFLVEDMERVRTDLDAWKNALAEGYPIIFGLKLYKSFDAHKKRGLVPSPSKQESGRADHGGHAMLCVGYSDPDKVFIVRNSWGTEWGDSGYCYIPYRYLMDDDFNFDDSWLIRQVEPLVFDEDTWGDDEPLLDDLQTVLGQMDDDAYQAFLDDLADTPLETRLALIVLVAAGADGETTDDELQALTDLLTAIFEAVGTTLSPARVIRRTQKLIDSLDEDDFTALFDETLTLFANHLSREALAGFIEQIAEVVSADDAAAEELEVLNALIQAWQVEDFGEYSTDADDEDDEDDEEEDDEEEDEDDEEDEDEEDEDEEGEELETQPLQDFIAEQSDSAYKKLVKGMGEVPLESRVAFLALTLIGRDREERAALCDLLDLLIEATEEEQSSKEVVRETAAMMKELEDEEAFLEDTLARLKRHLPPEVLAGLVEQLAEVAGASELTEDELSTLNSFIEAWELEAFGMYGTGEEEDEEA